MARSKRATLLIVLLLAMVVSSSANALTLQTISGTVRDADGHPISGAEVFDQSGTSTYTDGQGHYVLDRDLPTGADVTVLKTGIITQSRYVRTWEPLLGPTDFTMKYALGYSNFGHRSISKSNGSQTSSLTITTYAPYDRSQVVVTDSRLAGEQIATFESLDSATGSSTWTYTISISPETPTGFYTLTIAARSTNTGAELGRITSPASYEVRN
ncbi:MAG TPA: carboxypeptidase-like regulatory domain-containing protein [Actinomycetota bacterium]|nr:carboxypeptidase-like regulatory domain-containing protein [Actinomycetota bacterium]